MKRILIVLAAAVLGLFGMASAASAAPAHSAKAPSHVSASPEGSAPGTVSPAFTCGSGDLCFWVDAGYVNGPGQLAGSNPSWFAFSHASCVPPHASSLAGGTWADCASSIYNGGNSCQARVWYFAADTTGDLSGPSWTFGLGGGNSNLANVNVAGVNWNDNIEANTWVC